MSCTWRKSIRSTGAWILILFSYGIVSAAKIPNKGLAVAKEADARDLGWTDQYADVEMILKNRQGEVSVRKMAAQNLEVAGGGDKLLIRFDYPKDIRHTAFLCFTHKLAPDDQWIFLPALKRIKRISSHNKSGPFMGSEFAYEDITSQEVEKYTYAYQGEEWFEQALCHVVVRTPIDPKSGYTRQLVWFDQDAYRYRKIAYYDRKGDLLKTLVYSGYEKFHDRFWRAATMQMVNHQTGKETVLNWTNFTFFNGYQPVDFTRGRLKSRS